MTRAAGPGGTAGMQQAQDIDLHVGARIRLRRAMLGLSQQQCADGAGMPSRHRWSDIESNRAGKTNVRLSTLEAIAEVLRVEPGDLIEKKKRR